MDRLLLRPPALPPSCISIPVPALQTQRKVNSADLTQRWQGSMPSHKFYHIVLFCTRQVICVFSSVNFFPCTRFQIIGFVFQLYETVSGSAPFLSPSLRNRLRQHSLPFSVFTKPSLATPLLSSSLRIRPDKSAQKMQKDIFYKEHPLLFSYRILAKSSLR